MREKVTVLLIEDDLDFAALAGNRIDRDKRLSFVAHAPDKASGVEMARRLEPDVAVVDLSLSGLDVGGHDGIEAARAIRVSTGSKVVFLTAHDEPTLMKAASVTAFASGYLCKSQHQSICDEIYHAATAITPQKAFIKELVLGALSPAERAVLDGIVEGRIKGGAERSPGPFGSSPKTIANQRRIMLNKLGLKNVDELIHVFRNW